MFGMVTLKLKASVRIQHWARTQNWTQINSDQRVGHVTKELVTNELITAITNRLVL